MNRIHSNKLDNIYLIIVEKYLFFYFLKWQKYHLLYLTEYYLVQMS